MKNMHLNRDYLAYLFIAVTIYMFTTVGTAVADYPQNVITPSTGISLSNGAADFNFNAMATLGGYDRAVFFIDPGWTFTENWKHGGTSKDLNLGAGIRLFTPNIFSDGAIVGGNLYYDKKWTVNNNTYNQLGFGGELLSDFFDARINAFIPSSTKEGVDSNAKKTNFSQTAVHSRLKGGNEYAFSGYTTEFGFRLPFEKDLGIFRLFGGYDYFNASGINNLSTWKIKTTYSPTPYVQFAFNYYFHRSAYNSNWLLSVNANIPLDWAEFSTVDRFDRSEPTSRMHERVVRW